MTEDFEKQYLSDLLNHPILSPERERKLLKLAKVGNEAAKDELILCNQRLIVSIAKKYLHHGLSLLELINIGNEGLMTAIEKYDLATRNKLSTYASWWIRQGLGRAIEDEVRAIRIPNHWWGVQRQVDRVQTRLNGELGRQPTYEEIAAETDLTPERVAEIERWYWNPLSIDQPISDAEDADLLGDFIEDDRSNDVATLAEQAELAEKMELLLEGLGVRERKVLELRFGLNGFGGHPHTLEEVAQRFDVTRERIRQIEAGALKKLRHPRRARKVIGFLDD